MSSRNEQIAIRMLVGAVSGCLVVAMWTLWITLRPDDVGFYELLIYMPIVALAAWLPWYRPTPESLAIWAVIGWIASILFVKLVDPAIDHVHVAIRVPVMIAAALVLVGAPVAATLMGSSHMRDGERLGMKLHDLVKGVVVCAPLTIGLAIAQLPTHVHYGGVMLGVAFELLPALLVWRAPSRKRAALWWLFAFPSAGMHVLAVFTGIGLGNLLVTLLFYLAIVGIGVPIAILLTPRERPRIPEARIVDN